MDGLHPVPRCGRFAMLAIYFSHAARNTVTQSGPTKGVRYSWLVKDVVHQITLAALLRLRGRDEVASPDVGVTGS